LIITLLAMVVAVLLYVWLVYAADRARVRLHASVATLRTQSARLEQQALELERLRAAPVVTASATDLRTLVQARVDAAGLARVLVRLDATDANQVKVEFGALPFADWLAWVAVLQAQQVRLDTCRIEALSTPGLVSVNATFMRAAP
jgi:general secretion pathway protein M